MDPEAGGGGGRWRASGVPYKDFLGYDIQYGSYLTIEPKKVLAIAGPEIFIDPPPNLHTGRPAPVRRVRAPGRRTITDVAISPLGIEYPFLVRGSNTIWQANRLTGRVTKLAVGPAGASRLVVGGPALNLFRSRAQAAGRLRPHGAQCGQHGHGGHVFVAVRGRLVELDSAGKRVAGSPYAGLRAGSIVRVDRSFSNASRGRVIGFHPPPANAAFSLFPGR